MYRLIALLIGLPLLFSSCQSKPSAKTPQQLRLNIPSDPATLDPRKGGDLISSMFHFLLFEGLVRLNGDGTTSPALAESIEVSQDRKIYTFHLREAQWSDGTPITARDFETSWKDILAPDFPAANAHLLYPIENAQHYKMGQADREEVGIQALDDQTLKLSLTLPTPYFLELISFCVFFPVNAQLDRSNPHWDQQAGHRFLCSGPFTLANWKHNNEIVLTKNHKYWAQEKVRLEEIRISMVNNEMTALHMFEKGELDILGNPLTPLPLDAIPDLMKQTKLHIRPVAASTFCSFNVSQPPFHNQSIRKAFAYAINRKEIVNHITQLSEAPALSIIPSVLKKGKDSSFFPDAALEKARKCLKKGLAELGLSLKTFPSIVYLYSTSEIQQKVAQALQQQWHSVLGIKVELEGCEHKVLMDKLKARNYSIAQASWMAQYNDQMNLFERFKYADNVKNYSHWENEEFATLLDLSSQVETEEERDAVFQKAEALFLDEMPIAPIFHWNSAFIAQDHVLYFDLAPIGNGFFERIYIDMGSKGNPR